MPANYTRVRAALQSFDWKSMFVDELNWSKPKERSWTATVDGQTYTLKPVAEIGGMLIYTCRGENGGIPSSSTRRAIENQVKGRHYEHIVIFEDAAANDGPPARATLQWIKRGQGQTRSREFTYQRGQNGEALVQRLAGIAFDLSDLDEEGRITIAKVNERIARSLDVEKVTKKFYEEFTRQRGAFQKFLGGIPLEDDQRWYVSVMLNRLMFIYFIQKNNFLDKNPNYLSQKLEASQKRGANRFYRDFLRVLFFEGFAQPAEERSPEVRRLLGAIPYLNGGLFLPHPIEEKYGAAIDIPDQAFGNLFEFFDEWRWHLNERPEGDQRAIDPDVLGYIFEKYINQKQMGAYYSKEDITGYICRNTDHPGPLR